MEQFDKQINVQQVAIVIVDHGSRRDEANEMLLQFVQLFEARASFGIVESAHMELSEPSIATAINRCVERGAEHIVVAPYFLAPGNHWRKDIPQLVAEAASRHRGISCQVTQPLGIHPLMVEIVQARIDECLQA